MGQIYRRTALRNGPNPFLNVDGSVTPQVYSLTGITFQSFDVRAIQVYIECAGRFRSLDEFMALPALTNGLLLEVSSINETFASTTFRTNRDLSLIFPAQFNEVVTNKVLFNGAFDGKGQSIFKLDKNAEVHVTVRDDLTDLDAMLVILEGTVIE